MTDYTARIHEQIDTWKHPEVHLMQSHDGSWQILVRIDGGYTDHRDAAEVAEWFGWSAAAQVQRLLSSLHVEQGGELP